MRPARAVAGLGLVALTLGGCGPSAEEQTAVDSLATVMGTGINLDNSRLFGPDFPACFAEEFVAEAGLDRLVEDGVVAEDGRAISDLNSSRISEETATAYAAAEYECIEWAGMAAFLAGSGELAPATGPQVEEYVDCLADVDPDVWRANSRDQALSRDDTEEVDAFKAAVDACRAAAGVD